MINSGNQAFVKFMKENKTFLIRNQGNQCFATSALYLLFSQVPFRHAVIGIYFTKFRTAVLAMILDKRDKSDISKLLWNVLATANDDVNWLRCLLFKLSPELGDGQQKDQHEMLTLLLEKLGEVFSNYFVNLEQHQNNILGGSITTEGSSHFPCLNHPVSILSVQGCR